MPSTPCLRCGKLGKGSYCARHQPPRISSPSSLAPATPAQRRRALERAGHRCADCGATPTARNPLQVDAVVPVAEGGTHDDGNLRVRCRRCHRAKTRADLRRQAQRRRAAGS